MDRPRALRIRQLLLYKDAHCSHFSYTRLLGAGAHSFRPARPTASAGGNSMSARLPVRIRCENEPMRAGGGRSGAPSKSMTCSLSDTRLPWKPGAREAMRGWRLLCPHTLVATRGGVAVVALISARALDGHLSSRDVSALQSPALRDSALWAVPSWWSSHAGHFDVSHRS